MATPASYENRATTAVDLKDEKVAQAYEEGHDADTPPNLGAVKGLEASANQVDLEKGTRSAVSSSHSDDETLGGEPPAPTAQGGDEAHDPDVVDWEGPDDPKNPMNWPAKKKWGLIFVIAMVTLITPLGSSFFAPGVPQVLRDFNVHSEVLTEFVVSVYLLGFAIGPLVIAPLSEVYGRQITYLGCNVLFIIFTIACAVSTNLNMLIGFRFLAGCAGSSPLTIGGGTIADIMPREKRAGAMAIWAMGPLIGPVAGPVAGGFLTQAKGWRWVFWVTAIFAGAFTILLAVFGNETYAPVLLEKKAARLRKETGNPNLRSKMASGIPRKEFFKRATVRPLKLLFLSPIVLLMSIYISINYGILYLLFTTITFVFEGTYHWSTGTVGLSYIGSGVGMVIGMVILGAGSDRIIKKQQAIGDVKPEHRLPLILTVPGGVALPCGLFIYGWTTHYAVHWIVPIIGTGLVGIGLLSSMMTIQTYLVDAFTLHAASAMAANTVLRSIFGAFLPLAGLSMYNALGLGWGNSLLGFLGFIMIPVPIFFRYRGESIRTNPKFQVKL